MKQNEPKKQVYQDVCCPRCRQPVEHLGVNRMWCNYCNKPLDVSQVVILDRKGS